jgi:hypothetical protein
MSCETCHRYWNEVASTKLLLQRARFARNRKRRIHLVRLEIRSLEDAEKKAEKAHQVASAIWRDHWSSHMDGPTQVHYK